MAKRTEAARRRNSADTLARHQARWLVDPDYRETIRKRALAWYYKNRKAVLAKLRAKRLGLISSREVTR